MLNKFYEKIAHQIIDVLNKEIENAPLTKIERLELKPGDIIVLKSKYTLSAPDLEHLAKSITDIFPDNEHKVIILEDELDIAVISKGKLG